VFQALREFAGGVPPEGRMRPPHVVAVRASIHAPSFALEWERNHRDYFGPVCVGTVSSDSSGSRVVARVRRSRESWLIPSLIAFVAAIGWARGGGPGVGDFIALAAGLAVVTSWPLLMSLFSTNDYFFFNAPQLKRDPLGSAQGGQAGARCV